MSKDGKITYYTPEDTHSMIIGATRSGKSRNLVLPSIGLTAMAGESIIAVDMKGELFTDTRYFLESLGYEVLAIDFIQPRLSDRWNFLQPMIDASNRGDAPKMVTAARRIATMLVPDGHTNESIWMEGARSVLTTASLICVEQCGDAPEYQNLANVQQLITHMCSPVDNTGVLPINHYLENTPDDDPARASMGISQIAPSKMRGSFYASALTPLDVFADPAIYEMTSMTSFDPELTGKRKRAIFIILPDHDTTYHNLAALFVYQQYQILVDYANRRGGRLDRRVHIFADEFGNFVKIPGFKTLITVSGGRGIRWHIFIQNTEQLDSIYGREDAGTIRSNAETWVYLHSDSAATNKELSEKLGNYTVKAPSLSGSSTGQTSASYSLTGRPLMTGDEIGKNIKRPYQLVMTRHAPVVMYAPDLSKTVWNEAYGMGDEEYNRKLAILRGKERQRRFSLPSVEVSYCSFIWEEEIRQIRKEEEERKQRKGY